jgi:hypothetical protein
MVRRLFLLFVLLASLVSPAACTSAMEIPIAAPATTTQTAIPPTETPVSCQPSKVVESQVAFGEIQGDMQSEGQLWALLFFKTAWTHADQKIVWRITGEAG